MKAGSRIAFGLLVLAIAIGAPAAVAHERWLLTPYQMQALITAPPPDLLQSFGPLLGIVALAALAAILIGRALDSALAEQRERFQRRWSAHILPVALLVLRLGLAIQMADAALGLSPRHGSLLHAQPTLFFPDFEIRLLGPAADWLIPVQLGLAVMLALGFRVRIAAACVLLLIGYAFIEFDPGLVFTYAGHLAAPAVVLTMIGSGRVAVTPDTSSFAPDQAARAFAVLRILVGINFIALAFFDKILNTNLLIQVLTSTGFPTLGFPVDFVALVMAAVELSLGAMLVAGIMTRAVALTVIGAMLIFVITMNENMQMHAHLYADALALLAMGGGRLLRSPLGSLQLIKPRRSFLRFDAGAVAAAVSASLALALPPVWLAVAPRNLGDVSFLRLTEESQIPHVELATNVDGDGKVSVLIDTQNFKLADICKGGTVSGATGHIHVFVDGQLYDTSSIGAIDIAGLSPGQHEVSVVLVSTTHRAIVIGDRLVTAAADVVIPGSA